MQDSGQTIQWISVCARKILYWQFQWKETGQVFTWSITPHKWLWPTASTKALQNWGCHFKADGNLQNWYRSHSVTFMKKNSYMWNRPKEWNQAPKRVHRSPLEKRDHSFLQNGNLFSVHYNFYHSKRGQQWQVRSARQWTWEATSYLWLQLLYGRLWSKWWDARQLHLGLKEHELECFFTSLRSFSKSISFEQKPDNRKCFLSFKIEANSALLASGGADLAAPLQLITCQDAISQKWYLPPLWNTIPRRDMQYMQQQKKGVPV